MKKTIMITVLSILPMIAGANDSDAAKAAQARKMATRGCEMSWNQVTDVVLSGMTPEKAASASIAKIKTENPKLSAEQEKSYKMQSVDFLNKTLSNRKLVNDVKRNTTATRNAFMSTCINTTSKTLSGM